MMIKNEWLKNLQSTIAAVLLMVVTPLTTAATQDPTKIVPLPDVMMCKRIAADADQLYIADVASVYIYDLKSFALIKKFGKMGEGPEEFKVHPSQGIGLIVKDNMLEINSQGRISLFKKDGAFIKEIKQKIQGKSYLVGDIFLSHGWVRSQKDHYFTLELYTQSFKIIKEIQRVDCPVVMNKKWLFYSQFIMPRIYKDNIYITGGKGLEIDGFNRQGDKILSINHDYEKLDVTETHKKNFLEWMKTDKQQAAIYMIFKSHFQFPEYFPGIRNFVVVDDRIYIETYKKKDGKESEFVIFTIDGKYLKTRYLPLVERNPEAPYPYTVKNGKLYQLVENIDAEGWELHITPIL